MRLIFVLFFVFKAILSLDIETENEVLVLNSSNFEEAISQYLHLLVEFYAPWCGHCESLAPEYAKAAQLLKEESSMIRLAKVDATVEEELAKKYEVDGYPTIYFFKSGNHNEYIGKRTAEDIVQWLKKKTGPIAVTVASISECEAFIYSSEVAIVGFFSDINSTEAKTFLDVASSMMEKHSFAITSNFDVFDKYDVIDNSIILFKKFDEKRNDFNSEFTTKSIERFVAANSHSLVTKVYDANMDELLYGPVSDHIWLLTCISDENYTSVSKSFKQVANEFKGTVLFLTVDSSLEENEGILEFLIVNSNETPEIRFTRLGESYLHKFKLTEEINEESIRKFVKQVIRGQIKNILKSEGLPDDWDKEPVKVLVASNFDAIVLDKSKDVLVEFYSPWSKHCKQLEPIYNQLGELYKDNPNIVIAKMNGEKNDVDGVEYDVYPTIKLWKRSSNEVVDFVGDLTLEDLSKFIDTGGALNPKESSEEEDAEEENIPEDLFKEEL